MAAQTLFYLPLSTEHSLTSTATSKNQTLGPRFQRSARDDGRGCTKDGSYDHRVMSVRRGDHLLTSSSRNRTSTMLQSSVSASKDASVSLKEGPARASSHRSSDPPNSVPTRHSITGTRVVEHIDVKPPQSVQPNHSPPQHSKYSWSLTNQGSLLALVKNIPQKDRPCFSLLRRGRCGQGENCPYSHKPEIISAVTQELDLASIRTVGKGTRSEPNEARISRYGPTHPFQRELCHKFLTTGCDQNNCNFAHDLTRVSGGNACPRGKLSMELNTVQKNENKTESMQPTDPNTSISPAMPHFDSSVREKNVDQRHNEMKYLLSEKAITFPRKTEICRNFMRGACQRSNCFYFHDPAIAQARYKEMPKGQANQGIVSDLLSFIDNTNDRPSTGPADYKIRPLNIASDVSPGSRNAPTRPRQPQSATFRHQRTISRKQDSPCFAWRDGRCNLGDACSYVHDPEVQEAERVRKKQVAEEAVRTIQRLVFGSTRVTFGAGLSIQHIVTGFESCRVLVKNLPLNATSSDVENLFVKSGFSSDQFRLVVVRTAADGIHRVASIIFDNAEDGKSAAFSLEDHKFGDENLILQVTSSGKKGQMGERAYGELPILNLSFKAPSMRALVIYPSKEIAKAKALALDNEYCGGRQVRVALNQQPTGRVPLRHFIPNAVVINGLAVDVSEEEIHRFSDCFSIKCYPPREFSIPEALKQLQAHIEFMGGQKEKIEVLETPHYKGQVSIRAHFDTWKQAKAVFDSLLNKELGYLAGGRLNMLLPYPFQYCLHIPIRQYEAQKNVFSALIDDHGEDNAAHIVAYRLDDAYFLRVLGCDKKAVGSLKVRVERLAAGETIRDWDRFWYSDEGDEFLQFLFKKTRAYVCRDSRLSVLKAFGDSDAVEEARKEIKRKLEKLAAMEFWINLKAQSISFFVRKGVEILKEMVGEQNVTLDVSSVPCRITVRGGPDARHVLRNLVEESLSDQIRPAGSNKLNRCPLCLDEAVNPFPLACGHHYCNGCLQHLLTSALNGKQFPLCCIGNQGRCKKLIPIPVIERFLPLARINQLLEHAFRVYVDQHPQNFRYCSTPDCAQIYRVTEKPVFPQCPSCFAEVCSHCHSEAHQGLTCEEWTRNRDPEEQERLLRRWAHGQSNVKRCPDCRIFIEKVDGCNHMRCLCGSHVCWLCVKSYNDGIYEHLNDVHGGVFDLPPIA